MRPLKWTVAVPLSGVVVVPASPAASPLAASTPLLPSFFAASRRVVTRRVARFAAAGVSRVGSGGRLPGRVIGGAARCGKKERPEAGAHRRDPDVQAWRGRTRENCHEFAEITPRARSGCGRRGTVPLLGPGLTGGHRAVHRDAGGATIAAGVASPALARFPVRAELAGHVEVRGRRRLRPADQLTERDASAVREDDLGRSRCVSSSGQSTSGLPPFLHLGSSPPTSPPPRCPSAGRRTDPSADGRTPRWSLRRRQGAVPLVPLVEHAAVASGERRGRRAFTIEDAHRRASSADKRKRRVPLEAKRGVSGCGERSLRRRWSWRLPRPGLRSCARCRRRGRSGRRRGRGRRRPAPCRGPDGSCRPSCRCRRRCPARGG